MGVLSQIPLDLYHIRWEQSVALNFVVYVIYGTHHKQ